MTKHRVHCLQTLMSGLVAALAWSTSCVSFAQTTSVTCYSDVFAPYVVQDGDDADSEKVSGIDTDAILEAGKRVGIRVDFRILPWVRLEKEIEKGIHSQVDCAFAYTLTNARKLTMDFTTVPIKLSVLSIYSRKDAFPNFNGLEDFKGKTLGIRRGFKFPPALQAMVGKGEINIEEVDQDPQNFQKLVRGRIDGVLSNQDVAMAVLKQTSIDGIVELSPPVQTIATYLVFNKAKNLSALVPRFDKGIAEINADGSYRRIKAKYLLR